MECRLHLQINIPVLSLCAQISETLSFPNFWWIFLRNWEVCIFLPITCFATMKTKSTSYCVFVLFCENPPPHKLEKVLKLFFLWKKIISSLTQYKVYEINSKIKFSLDCTFYYTLNLKSNNSHVYHYIWLVIWINMKQNQLWTMSRSFMFMI